MAGSISLSSPHQSQSLIFMPCPGFVKSGTWLFCIVAPPCGLLLPPCRGGCVAAPAATGCGVFCNRLAYSMLCKQPFGAVKRAVLHPETGHISLQNGRKGREACIKTANGVTLLWTPTFASKKSSKLSFGLPQKQISYSKVRTLFSKVARLCLGMPKTDFLSLPLVNFLFFRDCH